ncbi:hypothetical protein CPB97_005043 [Podila verticillata]|nr:hypothetical protein CPB97_005043 [Podila verticillata]
MPSYPTRTASPTMFLKNILSSKRHRRVLLVLLILIIAASLSFNLYQPRPHWRRRTPLAPYGLDSTEKPITQENNKYRGKTQAVEIDVPASTWKCTDDDLSEDEKKTERNERTRQCFVENLCVDRQGAFIRSNGILSKNLPKVNLMSADIGADVYWQPRVERSWRSMMKAHYVNETLFIHGLYSPYHFSHWLYNGMMPLYSTMKRFGATKDSWTMRAARFAWDDITRQGDWEMDHFFYSGKELVLTQYEMATDFQTLPPVDAPICFKKAVIGLGSQCALDYCAKSIPAEVYRSFRDEVAEHYWNTPQTWQDHLTSSREKIERLHSGTKESETSKGPLKCLESARYYNFEGAGLNHGKEEGEHTARLGQIFPEKANSEQDYRDFSANGSSTASKESKRKLIVGIIQRESSRRLINDQDLIDGLVKAGFRVKWMSFDHGCGLAETAYLLRDVNVLVSPHGNAIGTSIFMPSHDPVPTVISIDNSRYDEPWFKFSATALGQRFISSVCGPHEYVDEATKERCPFYKDEIGGRKMLPQHPLVLGLPPSMVVSDEEKKGMTLEEKEEMTKEHRAYVAANPEAQALAETEFQQMIGPEVPMPMVYKYGEDVWSWNANFWKAIPRYVDVPRLVQFCEARQADLEREKQEDLAITVAGTQSFRHFVNYVRKGEACGVSYCQSILQRNVVGDDRGFGLHSVDNPALWETPTPESAALLQGLGEPKNWQPQELVA